MAARCSAVSYSRFSDPKQAAGDSSERQEREFKAFCQRHNLTPGKDVYADHGRSGFHDAHRKRGELGQLIAAAKDGRFDRGTVVVVEAWDRLGRLRPDRQTELIAELLRTGVSIGVCRLDLIFSEADFGTHNWTTLAVFVQLAHQESKQKSERVGASWDRRRERAREDGTFLGSSLPAWIENTDGKLKLKPERAETLRRIFKLAAEGLGHTRIVAALQGENVPPFGRRVVNAGRTRSQFSGRWSKAYVALLLRDRRVIGELQPMKNEKPDGPVLTGYFPAAISETEFNLARAAQEQRDKRDSKKRRVGFNQGKYTNIFKGLLTHARDGEGMLLHNKGTSKKPELLLINTRGNEGRSKCFTFPYLVFENCILECLKELNAADVMPKQGGVHSQVDVLRAKLTDLRAKLAKIQKDLKAEYSKALVEVLREVEAEAQSTTEQLQEELARTAKPLARSWGELPSVIDLIEKADDPDAARLKVRAALRAIVESGTVLIVSRGSWRYTAVQFFFTGGATRHFLIAHQTAGFRRTGSSAVSSFAAAGLPALDLRKPADAKRLEAAILRTLKKPE